MSPPAAGRSPLASLHRRIVACRACPRLVAHCREVARVKRRAYREQEYWGRPVPGFGDPAGRLLVVGLAPAAHGANRTGRVFTGDSSGDWLYEALHRYGFASQRRATSRDDGLELRGAFITSALRCAPPGNRPLPGERARCLPFMQEEMGLLEHVAVILPLGGIAHDAWLRASGWHGKLAPRERPRFSHRAESRLPDGKVLLASYHPSRQNTSTGRLTRRMWHAVFARARALAGP